MLLILNSNPPRFRSIFRILLDIFFWVAAVALALWVQRPWASVLAVLWIGAFPMHDILLHGHEGTHRLLSPNAKLNGFLTWFSHALVGISGSAYRSFHLDHHAFAQTPKDPEYQMISRVAPGAPGWAFLGIPILSHLFVNSYPARCKSSISLRRKVLRDLMGAALFHLVLGYILGLHLYLCFVFAPIVTSLSAALIVQSLCEHHGVHAEGHWRNTRGMVTNRALQFLWSNVNHHLEHHLYPFVPHYQLPKLREQLAKTYQEKGSVIDRGYLRTAWRLLWEPKHF